MNIITLGGATQDILIAHQDAQTLQWHTKESTHSFILLQEGTKMEVRDIHYSTGGGATNAAVSFKRLGFSAIPVCKIGNDYAGQAVLENLEAEKIATQFCCIDKTASTAISYIIPATSGDRTVLTFRGKNTELQEQEFPFEQLNTCHGIYITSLRGKSAHLLHPVAQHAKTRNVVVAHNPGSSQLSTNITALSVALSCIDILILNLEEAQQFMQTLFGVMQPLHLKNSSKELPKLLATGLIAKPGFFNLPYFFQEVAARGPRIIVVTNGADGVYVYYQKTIYFHPSIPVHIASTLGAGDAFGSCFVATLLQNLPLEQAIIRGIINSSSVISKLGAKNGLLSLQELEEHAQQIGINKIQQFTLPQK